MSIPLAAFGAVVAALFEASVLPEVMIAGAKPDLVFILAVTVTMMIGVEDGLTWAFVGGLMLDLLTPGRQLGATSLTLLLAVGGAVVIARILPQRQVWSAVAAVFVLSWLFEVLLAAVLALTAGTGGGPSMGSLAPIVVFSTLLAVPIAAATRVAWLRFGTPDRMDW